MHLLRSDTVPKYRVENGAEEGGTVRTINIHSPSTGKAGLRRNPLFSNTVLNVAPLSHTGHTFEVPRFGSGRVVAVDVHVLF